MALLYVLGSVCSSGGVVGSSYMMVSTLKCVMICESRKGPVWGLGLLYHFSFGDTSIMTSSRSFWQQGMPNEGFVELRF